MEEFPCPLERTVASALLLLATTPPSLSPPNKSKSNESEKSLELLSNSKPLISSASIRHRAEEIMRLLPNDCASEVRIRHLLGDSPDTSKALRMLLKQEKIKRMGAGGRRDPYIYTIASMKQQ
ncbi:unnamed protein product [Camellia sinensis]